MADSVHGRAVKAVQRWPAVDARQQSAAGNNKTNELLYPCLLTLFLSRSISLPFSFVFELPYSCLLTLSRSVTDALDRGGTDTFSGLDAVPKRGGWKKRSERGGMTHGRQPLACGCLLPALLTTRLLAAREARRMEQGWSERSSLFPCVFSHLHPWGEVEVREGEADKLKEGVLGGRGCPTPAMRREYGSEGVQCGAISNACHEKGGAAWGSGELLRAAAEREARQQQLHGREEGGGAQHGGVESWSGRLQSGRRGSSSYTGGKREAGWGAEEEGAAAPAAPSFRREHGAEGGEHFPLFFRLLFISLSHGAAWRSGELVGAAAEREARQQQLHGREEGGGLGCGGGGSSSTSSAFFQKGGAAWRSEELVGAAAAREARQQQLHLREEEGAAAPAAFFQKGVWGSGRETFSALVLSGGSHLTVVLGYNVRSSAPGGQEEPPMHTYSARIPPRHSLSFHYPPPSHLTSPFSLSTLVSSRQPISSHPTPPILKDAERAPWWSKLVGVEQWRAVLHDASFKYCLLRLDSPIFNAPPAEPLADPVTEPAALPFTATGKLTYSHGMHLKYAVNVSMGDHVLLTSAWATMLHNLDAHMHAQIDCLLASSHPPNPSALLPTPPPFPSSLLATTTAFWAGALDPSDPSPSSSLSFFSSSSSSSTSSSAAHPTSPRFPPSAAAAAEAAVAMTGGPGECFPKLRAMAQVLLLPKDLLADQERELRQEADKELQAACLNYCKGAQDVLISMKKKAAEQARNDTAAVYQRLQDQIANYINLAKKTDIGTKNSKLTDNLTFFKDRVISEFKDAMSVFVMETNLSEIHVKEQKKEIDEKKAAAAEEAENLPVDPSVREIAKQEVAKAVAKLKSTPPPHHRRAAANNAANNNDKKKNMKQKQVKQTKQKKTFPVKNNRKPFAVNAAKKPNTAAAKKPTNGKKRKNGSTNHSGRAFTKAAGRSVNHPTKKTSPAKNGGGSGRGGTARQ
ncbi:unnamed protein product [Closterium sp. NIES-65]|nr:unnamed protein product [Closterium sp. NIES-65]